METNYSNLRNKLKSFMDKACFDREPVTIKRRTGGNVVMLAEEDYTSLLETAYLLRSPKMAKRLLKAKAGKKGISLEEARKSLGI